MKGKLEPKEGNSFTQKIIRGILSFTIILPQKNLCLSLVFFVVHVLSDNELLSETTSIFSDGR